MKNVVLGIVIGVLLVAFGFGLAVRAAAPSGFAVTDKVSAPLQRGPTIVTAATSTTRAAVFADLGSDKKDSVVQLITIESDASNDDRVCVKQVDLTVAAPETCNNALCTAQSFTCDGTATDGEWLDPGETMPLRPSGHVCVCTKAAAGTPLIQAKRAAR